MGKTKEKQKEKHKKPMKPEKKSMSMVSEKRIKEYGDRKKK